MPKPEQGSRREKALKDAPKLSRYESLKRDGVVPAMPPNPAPHIIDRLAEIGMTEAAGMGVVPISWREIAAWSEMTGVVLDPWEARLLRQLSAAYVTEHSRAEDESRAAPWRAPRSRREIEAEAARLRAALLG